jgi:hypothetical protein
MTGRTPHHAHLWCKALDWVDAPDVVIGDFQRYSIQFVQMVKELYAR